MREREEEDNDDKVKDYSSYLCPTLEAFWLLLLSMALWEKRLSLCIKELKKLEKNVIVFIVVFLLLWLIL